MKTRTYSPSGMLQHFAPNEERLRDALDACPSSGIIYDLGGASNPFPKATRVFDCREGSDYLDLEMDPFPDCADFVYCRHVLEDLADPSNALAQMEKRSRAGYLEFPSVVVECCRGVESEHWVGLWHHRWFVWVDEGLLHFFPKLGITNAFTYPQERLRKHLEDPEKWNVWCHYNAQQPLLWKVWNLAKEDVNLDRYMGILSSALARELG